MAEAKSGEMGKNYAESYMEAQMLQQQLDQIQKLLEQVDVQLQELSSMTQQLDDLEKLPANAEILVPVVRGMFAKATLHDVKSLSVHVGADTLVEKTLPDAGKMLEEQLIELTNYKEELSTQQSAVMQKLRQMAAQLEQ